MAQTSPNLRLVPANPDAPSKVESILDLIGNTPLLEIQRIGEGLPEGVKVFAKLEGFNPGGSVKDRPAWRMIQEGLRTQKLRPGKTILDSTSGNTGIALAMIGAILGYPVELVIPANVSVERKQIIDAYGAKMIFSDPMEGSDGAIRLCRKLLEADPEKYFKPDQYFNPMNPQAHYENTGPEIYRQTNQDHHPLRRRHRHRRHDHGHRPLFERSQSDRSRVIAVEPDDALHGLEGLETYGQFDRARASITRKNWTRRFRCPPKTPMRWSIA